MGFKKFAGLEVTIIFQQTLPIFDRIPTDSCKFPTKKIMGASFLILLLELYENSVLSRKFRIFGRKFFDNIKFSTIFRRPKIQGGQLLLRMPERFFRARQRCNAISHVSHILTKFSHVFTFCQGFLRIKRGRRTALEHVYTHGIKGKSPKQ